ncbi:hypothetical protein ACFFJN_21465 [Erwinia mallotivora]|uniref:hypothetical protein n=1 Tax=Erwinia mallotivora TaxID=69222 RepID=UPI0035EA55DE
MKTIFKFVVLFSLSAFAAFNANAAHGGGVKSYPGEHGSGFITPCPDNNPYCISDEGLN